MPSETKYNSKPVRQPKGKARVKTNSRNHVTNNVAGIDLGATLIKIALTTSRRQDQIRHNYTLYSSADYSIAELAQLLKDHHVTSAQCVGINELPTQFRFLNLLPGGKNKISHELRTQVAGVRLLADVPKNFLLVSIGTGTSYTHVGPRIIQEPLGSALGGGYIAGMSTLLGFKDYAHMCLAASFGNHKNVDGYYNDLIVSHMQDATSRSSKKDVAAGIMNTVAVNIWKDIVTLSREKNIVFIGSTLNNNPVLKSLLKKYLRQSKRQALFIHHGEYAGAIGALESATI